MTILLSPNLPSRKSATLNLLKSPTEFYPVWHSLQVFNHRPFIVLMGDLDWARQQWQTHFAPCLPEDTSGILVSPLGKQHPWAASVASLRCIQSQQSRQILGCQVGYALYEAQQEFNASSLCALAGTVMGGGILVLLMPPEQQWISTADQQWCAFNGHNVTYSRFKWWWLQQWKQFKHIYVLPQVVDGGAPSYSPMPGKQLLSMVHHQKQSLDISDQLTTEQVVLIEAMVECGLQTKPQVLLVHAERGRGKSTTLGLGLNALASCGYNAGDVVVTAPARTAIAAMIAVSSWPIHFVAVDILQRQLTPARLLIIDEAAAIPLATLQQLLAYYPRIVMASTRHGYEGSGQGYRLKLPHLLQQLQRPWREIQLTYPLRYNANDPLESFIKHSFLCAQEAPDVDITTGPDLLLRHCCWQLMPIDDLIHDQSLLQQVYGLLMLAHYQTKPQDLRLLLDHQGMLLFLLRRSSAQDSEVVGALWISQEGGLDAALSAAITTGDRRINGHLLPQILAQQGHCSTALTLTCWRIVRIVVRPDLQRSGLGQRMLQCLCQQAALHDGVDYLGTSFGVSNELLRFWLAADYQPVWLSVRPDSSSGLTAIQLIKPMSTAARAMAANQQPHFYSYLAYSRQRFLAHLDQCLWPVLGSMQDNQNVVVDLVPLLRAFAVAKAGFSGPLYGLRRALQWLQQRPASLMVLATEIRPLAHYFLADTPVPQLQRMGLVKSRRDYQVQVRLLAGQVVDLLPTTVEVKIFPLHRYTRSDV